MSNQSNTIYASPTGSGVGTEADPYSIADALNNLEAGTTLYLKAGTYSNVTSKFTSSGSSYNPIYIKPAPGAHVILDIVDDMIISGNYLIIDGKGGLLELMTDSWTGDRFLTSENFDLAIFGVGAQIKNCFIHDFGNVGNWGPAINSVLQGNLIYNIGRGNGSQGHPHYAQNNLGTKTIKENIFSQTYESNYTNHQYGSGNSTLKGFLYSKNIYINAGFLAGSAAAKVSDMTIDGCEFVVASMQIGLLGLTDPEHDNFHVDNSYFFDSPVQVKNGKDYSIRNNYFALKTVGVLVINNGSANGLDIDENHYNFYEPVPYNKWGYPGGVTNYQALSGWQNAIGGSPAIDQNFDLNGSSNEYPGSVPPDSYRVIPHTDDTERAFVRIANYSQAANVSVDLSTVSGLVNGTSYRLYNSQNPDEYYEFTYNGSAVSVPMTGWTMATPIATSGGAMTPKTNLFPKYGVFYLMKAI